SLRAQGLTPTAEALYADAAAKETAVRKALALPNPPPTVLRAVRTVVLDFESVVRRYPASDLGDDALWRAALLSSDAFRVFLDAREQQSGTKLLQTLIAQYPSSPLARQSPALIAELSVLSPRVNVTVAPPAAAETPRPPVSSPTSVGSAPPAAAAPASPPATSAAPAPLSAKTSRQADKQLAIINGIRRVTLPDVVRVIIELDREVSFRDNRLTNPDRVFLDLPSTVAAKTLLDQTLRFDGDTDPVHQIRLGRHPNNTTRVVLEAEAVSSYSVYALYNPFRLVVDCMRGTRVEKTSASTPAIPTITPGRTPALSPFPRALPPRGPAALSARRVEPWTLTTPAVTATNATAIREASIEPLPEPPPAAPVTAATVSMLPSVPVPVPAPLAVAAIGTSIETPSRMLSGGFSLARQLGMGVSRIVIDPGHGGHDPGAKGIGASEADLVLDVALRLEKLFQSSPGIEVILTRRTDAYVTLQERTSIANRENADLFLSIHANANDVASARGVETYFLNFANSPGTAATAARENAAAGRAMGELPDVVKAIALNSKLQESRDFAIYVQREMVARLGTSGKNPRNLGVKQAPFQVLIGAAMPSILTEVAFLSNTQEAKLVKQAAYRQKIAEALFSAVRKYQNSLSRVQSHVAQQ
ncbi:MAG: N-acetylmuramoyl-L-alanine amidase, partial [Vicinamibacterales bacterium]